MFPTTDFGRQLLAHELIHTIQQDPHTLTKYDTTISGIKKMSLGTLDIQRFYHTDCNEDDLRSIVWPDDALARRMVKNAVATLSQDATPPLQERIRAWFNTDDPNHISRIKKNFERLDSIFNENDYKYECEYDCESGSPIKYAYTYPVWANIHLCINNLKDFDDRFVAICPFYMEILIAVI